MLPQRRILDSLKMYKIAEQVVRFIEETMQAWRVEMTAGEKRLALVKMQIGTFQWGCTITITICYSHDVIQTRALEMHSLIQTL